MLITDIYSRYRIPVIIQQHQLRVASVARTIAEAYAGSCDAEVVTQVGLLHDMGNIIKIQFETFPYLWEKEGLEYWKQVQAEMLARGANEHVATLAIAREIGVSETVLHCIDMISFAHVERVVQSGTLEEKISVYADNRVGPFGVLSLFDRLEEAKQRYMTRTDRIFDHIRHEKIVSLTMQLETEIFAGLELQPDDITDTHIAPIVERLSCYTFA